MNNVKREKTRTSGRGENKIPGPRVGIAISLAIRSYPSLFKWVVIDIGVSCLILKHRGSDHKNLPPP